ncbi:MAG: nucleotidyltransferase domain-containing protein [Planctomycetota bacterium]
MILFGSHARSDADDHSDIDLLVVEPVADDRFEEMIRLNRALKGPVMPAELLVVSEQEFEERSATPGARWNIMPDVRAGCCMPPDRNVFTGVMPCPSCSRRRCC